MSQINHITCLWFIPKSCTTRVTLLGHLGFHVCASEIVYMVHDLQHLHKFYPILHYYIFFSSSSLYLLFQICFFFFIYVIFKNVFQTSLNMSYFFLKNYIIFKNLTHYFPLSIIFLVMSRGVCILSY